MKLGSNDIGSVYIGSTAVNKIYIGSTEVWSSFTGLLDTYTGAAAAYSLRLLSSTYTGDAIRVRRASDNAETNIGFVSGQLDTTTLETFCSGTNGFVTTWYDQSGNGYDATQTTASNQPQIVSSGSTITENGKPAIQSTSTTGLQTISNIDFSSSSDINVFSIHNVDNINQDNAIVQHSDVFSIKGAFYLMRSSVGRLNSVQRIVSTSTYIIIQSVNNPIYNNQVLINMMISQPQVDTNYLTTYENGVNLTNEVYPTFSGTSVSFVNDTLSLYSRSGNTVGFRGKYQELILYPSDQSSNRTGIETNINSQYQIYWDGSQTSLLDTYGGSAAAYSLRALSSSYTGALIKVRRASDNAEQDIYAKYDGTLNTDVLESFCSGTNGFVTTWYDQSGNGRNATQTTSANQPQIVSSGSTIVENGKPCVQFDGSDDSLATTGNSFSATETTIIAVAKQSAVLNSFKRLFCVGAYNDGRHLGTMLNQDDMLAIFNNSILTCFGGSSTSQNLSLMYNISTTGYLRQNGTQVNTVTASNASYGTENIFIGTDKNKNPVDFWNGIGQEFIFYPNEQSANNTGIETNINNFYNIY